MSEPDTTSISNNVRLTLREWAMVAVAVLLLTVLAPFLWQRAENFEPGQDYRIPYDLSQDYWLYDRYARLAAGKHDTLLIGDSVVWGQYVTPDGTLSHWLNQLAGSERFANLGLDGAHPAALAGLVEHYTGGVTGKDVIVQCNLLWLSSPRLDLQGKEEFVFNHPRLVAQFFPPIPCYKEEMSARIGIVVEQHLTFSRWTNHLQHAYFGASDVASWTMDHPYENPVGRIRAGLPAMDNGHREEPVSWAKKGIKKQAFDWVDAQTSNQWRYFRQAISTLRERGNRVFVLVGPFNEHMIASESFKGYAGLKRALEDWLRRENIACYAPAPLASELYADASHPLAAGYAQLARDLLPRLSKE